MIRHRFGRLAAGIVLVGSICAASAASLALPASAYGPHPQCAIHLNHTAIPVHGVVTVSITCVPNATIVIEIDGVTLGTITTNAAGNGSGTFTIPASLAAGNYVITATDPAGLSFSTGLALTAAAPASGPLPFTGADVAMTAGVGAVAVGGGGLIVLGARRRRRSHPSVSNA